MIIFEKKYKNYFMGGLFSGLLVGGAIDLITGYHFFWVLFVTLGIQQGIIMAQREKIRDYAKESIGVKE